MTTKRGHIVQRIIHDALMEDTYIVSDENGKMLAMLSVPMGTHESVVFEQLDTMGV